MHFYFIPVVNEVKRKVFETDSKGNLVKHEVTGKDGIKKLLPIQKKDASGKNMLTNEIYKSLSGMKANEYKSFKGIRKESLRDNMTDIEFLLTDLGEIATCDIAESERPQGFRENMKVARKGGQVANDARKSYEKATKKKAISNQNALNYQYIDENKQIENKQ